MTADRRKYSRITDEDLAKVRAAAEAIAANKVDPGAFYKQLAAEVDARLAEMQARAMKYLLEPMVHVVDTPAGPLTIKADPTLKPGEMRILKPRREFVIPPGASQRGTPCMTCGEEWGDHYGFACDRPTVETPWMRLDGPPADPLDVKYDGVTLRVLLARDRFNRLEFAQQDGEATPFVITPAQRAAVSAHWSAELRARVEAAKDRERRRVVVDLEGP